MHRKYIRAVVEDALQESVLLKLLRQYRQDLCLEFTLGKRGNQYIREHINGFIQASRAQIHHIILTDLDYISCSPQLFRDWNIEVLNNNCLVRVAVREIEAWIIADRENFAAFMGIPVSRIPINTELIADPKAFIVNQARSAKKKELKDIVPLGIGKQGPGYNTLIQRFIENEWEPESARKYNRSLDKAIVRLSDFLKP